MRAWDVRLGAAAVSVDVIAILAVLVCGSGSRPPDASFPKCPRTGPPQFSARAPVGHATGGVRVPEAAAAQVCLYDFNRDRGRGYTLTRSVELTPTLTRTLTHLLALGIQRPAEGSCATNPLVLRLRDEAGSISTFTLAGCLPAYVTRGGHSAALSGMAANALGGLGGYVPPPPTRTTPSFLGRPLTSAMLDAKSRHVHLGATDELVDPTVPLGTIVWQTPLAGGPQDDSNVAVSAYVAVPPSTRCSAEQLRGRYLNGGRAMGQKFGGVALLNVSPRPCVLTGRLTLNGQNSSGTTVTESISQPTGDRFVLSPNATPRKLHAADGSALTVTFAFAGNHRDDPNISDGQCREWAQPAIWTVRLGDAGSIVFPNGGRGAQGSFYSCHGELYFDTDLNVIGATGVHLSGN